MERAWCSASVLASASSFVAPAVKYSQPPFLSQHVLVTSFGAVHHWRAELRGSAPEVVSEQLLALVLLPFEAASRRAPIAGALEVQVGQVGDQLHRLCLHRTPAIGKQEPGQRQLPVWTQSYDCPIDLQMALPLAAVPYQQQCRQDEGDTVGPLPSQRTLPRGLAVSKW